MVSVMWNVTNNVFVRIASLALLLFGATSLHAQNTTVPNTGPQKPAPLQDQPAQAYQLELIDLAWRSATAYPLDPHIKNRGKAEERVVTGLIELGRLQQAWDKADQVVNWRRGACYAEIAHALIKQGQTQPVEYFLQQAVLYARDPLQGWRQDRVKARVAQARILLGQAEQADELIAEEDLQGKGERVSTEAGIAADEDYDRLVAMCDELVTTEGYEAILGALAGYADLYARYYDNADRRAELIAKIRKAWEPMPAIRRFELLLQLVDAALEHEDRDSAVALADEADAMRASYAWSVDYDLRLRADVARLRGRLGQDEQAKTILDEALPVFEKGQDKLENFYRAGALRPIAEAYAKLGQTDRARELYAKVVELGAVNPNLRPRISDITETCVSMALHGVEPDTTTFGRIREIVGGLGDR